MLLAEIKTNLPSQRLHKNFEEKCAKKLSALVGVPTNQISIVLYTDIHMRMYQSTAPILILRAWAEGGLFGRDKNKQIVNPLIDMLAEETGLPDQRVLLTLHPLDSDIQSIVPATGSW